MSPEYIISSAQDFSVPTMFSFRFYMVATDRIAKENESLSGTLSRGGRSEVGGVGLAGEDELQRKKDK